MSENRGLFTTDKAQAYLALEPDMAVEQLSDRLWTLSDGVYRTIFLNGREGVIAFDTFGTPGKARAYARAISQAIPGKEISTIIYSHDHLDHAGFAADLAPAAEIIADEICAKVIKLRQAEGQRQPTRVISGAENNITVDGTDLVLLNPGPTHGSGNLAAWFAEENCCSRRIPSSLMPVMACYRIFTWRTSSGSCAAFWSWTGTALFQDVMKSLIGRVLSEVAIT